MLTVRLETFEVRSERERGVVGGVASGRVTIYPGKIKDKFCRRELVLEIATRHIVGAVNPNGHSTISLLCT